MDALSSTRQIIWADDEFLTTVASRDSHAVMDCTAIEDAQAHGVLDAACAVRMLPRLLPVDARVIEPAIRAFMVYDSCR